jgi:hypothetical protein
MPRIRQEIAQGVAEQLHAVEIAIDMAVARAAELTAAMPRARTDARFPAQVGQEAMGKTAQAVTALVQARGHIVEAHQSLDIVRTEWRIPEVGVGDLVPKVPAELGEDDSAPRLRRVA